jgi:hypothetical protein
LLLDATQLLGSILLGIGASADSGVLYVLLLLQPLILAIQKLVFVLFVLQQCLDPPHFVHQVAKTVLVLLETLLDISFLHFTVSPRDHHLIESLHLLFEGGIFDEQMLELLLKMPVLFLPGGEQPLPILDLGRVAQIGVAGDPRALENLCEWGCGLPDDAAVGDVGTGRTDGFAVDPAAEFGLHFEQQINFIGARAAIKIIAPPSW